MPDDPALLHVSSAIVMARPDRNAEVARRIAAMPDTQVAFAEGGRLIVVLEATNADAIGARLTDIAAFEDVLAVNLTFEHADTPAIEEEQA